MRPGYGALSDAARYYAAASSPTPRRSLAFCGPHHHSYAARPRLRGADQSRPLAGQPAPLRTGSDVLHSPVQADRVRCPDPSANPTGVLAMLQAASTAS